jgi:actin-related protein
LIFFVLDETNAVVVDFGTAYCKFGTGGQDSPRHVFDSVSSV